MNLDRVVATYHAHSTVLASLIVLAALVPVLLIASRLRRAGANRLTLITANLLTIVAAVLATTVSASGMWKFFTTILGPSPLRIAFFAYIEVALFASALLARMRLLRDPDKGSTGADGIAVWVLAGITATLSALDADSFREVCLRLVAPMVAAWMWERALAAERSARLGRTVEGVHWALTLERILVWLHLAEAQDRDVSQVDRARRRARLARARLHLHLLQTRQPAPTRRLRRAHNRVIRLAMQSAEHTGLADFRDAGDEREAMQMFMATLYGFVDATSPEAVNQLNAWRTAPTAPDRLPADSTEAPTESALRQNSTNSRTPSPPADGERQDSQRTDSHGQDADTTEDVANAVVVEIHARTSQHEREHARPSSLDQDSGEGHDQLDDNDSSESSSVAAMRRFWDNEVKRGHIPSGAELSRAAGVPPTTGLGRRKRREWEAEVSGRLPTAARR